MTSSSRNRSTARPTTTGAGRRSPSGEIPKPAKQTSNRRPSVLAVVGASALIVAGGVYALSRSDNGAAGTAAAPYVGGDLHVLASFDDRLYVGGHDGAAVSTDDGRTWSALTSLRGADPMGWAEIANGDMLVGGHPGLYRSTDAGATFTQLTGGTAVPDVHALGAAGNTAYLASPQAGFLASADGGATWQVRNTDIGQGFMGTILVDPEDPQRLIVPDMMNGLVFSSDGGANWTRLGGPSGVMAAAWDPTDTDRLVAVGMDDSAMSNDGGATWTSLQVPDGTSAVTFSADGQTLYAAALDGTSAMTSISTDQGATWARP